MTSEFYIKPPSSKARAPSKALRRGKACTNCRLLKIKCDGFKPVCGPCLRNPRPDPCEYTDQSGSRTKALEETVARLEARIRELEHPDQATPSVMLHDPYGIKQSPSLGEGATLLSELYSPSSTHRSLGSSLSPSSSLEPHLNSSPNQEPNLATIKDLLDTFLPFSTEFGFFLHVARFQNAALLPLTFGHYSRPLPALLSAVYLWGIRLSRSDQLLAQEPGYLARALEHTATALPSAHPHKIVHLVQAEILLAHYFLRDGRLFEAKIHASAAVSLALASGLHQVRALHPHPPPIESVRAMGPILAPAADDVEEGERINCFWAVFILRKCLSVILEPSSTLCGALEAPGMQIDTPWPLDIEGYKEGLMPPGSFTIRNFMNEAPGEDDDAGYSIPALHAKAASMFHRAAHLAGHWSPNFSPRETHAFNSAFLSLDRLIDKFRTSLLPVDRSQVSTTSDVHTLATIQTLAQAATVKLHAVFARVDALSNQKCMIAARRILELITEFGLAELAHVNPILGTLWMDACQVLISEMSRLRHLHTEWSQDAVGASLDDLAATLDIGLSTMATFAPQNPLMTYQLTKIREAYSAV